MTRDHLAGERCNFSSDYVTSGYFGLSDAYFKIYLQCDSPHGDHKNLIHLISIERIEALDFNFVDGSPEQYTLKYCSSRPEIQRATFDESIEFARQRNVLREDFAIALEFDESLCDALSAVSERQVELLESEY